MDDSYIIKDMVHKRCIWAGLVIISLIAIGLGAYLLISQTQQPHPVPVRSPALSENAPSSTKHSADEIANYKVAPDLPRYLTIPAIGVAKTRVRQLGASKNNQIASPDNIYDVGWYKGSAKPGQNGAMFMFGHVSSWTANGVFYNLKRLKPNDKIVIERGDGKTFTYAVRTSKIYPANNVDMHTALSAIDMNTQGLNLMTCTGKVVKDTNDFSERLVVYSRLVAS